MKIQYERIKVQKCEIHVGMSLEVEKRDYLPGREGR
jgi:hypothetical protein